MTSQTLDRNRDTSAQQTLLEHQILQHVSTALQLSLRWDVHDVGPAKKLSTVRFTAQSFQRHLERLLDLEEGGGYMQTVRDWRPGLSEKAEALRKEHDDFRNALAAILRDLESLSAGEDQPLDQTCQSLTELLERLDRHHRKEIALIHEAMSDVGGEG